MSIEKKKCVKCDIVFGMLKEPCPLKNSLGTLKKILVQTEKQTCLPILYKG